MLRVISFMFTGAERHGAGVHAGGLGKPWEACARPGSRPAACQELRQILGAAARPTHDFGALMHRYEPAWSWDARRQTGQRVDVTVPVHKEAEFLGGMPPSERLIYSPRFGTRYASYPDSPMPSTP